MPRRDLTRITITLAAAVFASIAIAGPASATTTKSEEVCWSNGDTGEFSCFDSEAAFEAELVERGIALIVPSSATSRAAGGTESIGADLAVAVASTNLLARFWDGTSYTGATFLHSASVSSCASYSSLKNMPDDWNDKVSSFQAYDGCRVRIYQHTGGGGNYYGYVTSTTVVGNGLNNQGSSYRIAD